MPMSANSNANSNPIPNSSTVSFQNDPSQGLNSASGGKKISPAKILMLILLSILIIGGGIFLAFKFISGSFNFLQREEAPNKRQKTWTAPPEDIGKYELPPIPPPTTQAIEPEPIKEEQVVVPEVLIEPLVPQEMSSPSQPTEPQPPSLKERRLGATVRSYNAAQMPSAPETVQTRQVKLMRNIDYSLIKGTKIPCTLETTIISEQQGFTSCIINQDIYSGNARVLLIEKGTKVTGEYNGDIKNGDRRLQIIWDRLITPYDVVIQLDSPVTDRLGASGTTGKVDNRWMTRIGSALLVSMFNDTLEIMAKNSDSAEVVVESNTSETSQDLAKEILDKNINLPPIVYMQEGQMINIYVADDIDLSSIYRTQNIQ